ncbi:MAG: preprotein translocase subunit SecA [Clostridiales bacterium]|nr:preprotein translocase subunit SecA [Clostridiales bacterium]
MFKLFGNLFDDNAKDIKKYTRILQSINDLERETKALADEELTAKTALFRQRLDNGEELPYLLPEAFAVVREAAWRTLSMRHFDEQLIGGMALSDGRISEMKTGEGKTLVATAPAYLNALDGQGVHVITVNDYLAKRDSEWMGRVYRFLGMKVGLIIHGVEPPERRVAYAADITYGTNNEFGFDYLRDNMAASPAQMVQRPLNYCIVDEVDSILIDEARTPLIISGAADKPTEVYYTVAKIIPRLRKEDDYTVDEKLRTAALTEDGVAKMEKALGVENLYDDKHVELSHHVNQALRAFALFRRDRDYVVKEGEVIIVDEFTGRLMFGRRYSDGLHQAIEAKEGVQIERESQTLASITFQNYFRMYKKLAGMTGTARTEEEEFRKIYKFDVVEIPTHLPMVREDSPDVVYRTELGKFQAIVGEIEEEHQKGRPILVGTVSIEKSERLSDMLRKKGIDHQVLNAKHHEREAEIIAQAGRLSSVTIATNMAGRGTDIVLGGSAEAMANREMAQEKEADPDREYTDSERLALIEKYKVQTTAEHDQVVEAGGLHIIGTERHESRRIDNQLRGRAGRQGDPGSSRFFISMEDDLMRLFGGDNLAGVMDRLGMDDSTPIDAAILSKQIESAQKRVESRHFDSRKSVLDYDDVMNKQREIIYGQRRRALSGDNLKESIEDMIHKVIERTVAYYSTVSKYPEEWDLAVLLNDAEAFLVDENKPKAGDLANMAAAEIPELFKERAFAYYAAKEKDMGEEKLRQLERLVILRVVDEKWMDHLDAMDQLRQGIGLRAYGQTDPLIAYKKEAFNMFQQMSEDIQVEVVRLCMRAVFVEAPVEKKQTVENRGDGTVTKKPIRKKKEEQVGRNDPCPCGSGKKFKKCCGMDNDS